MTKLDEIAVNIELVLISLIEGVALVMLAERAVEALNDPEWYSYIPFIMAGLSILLVFWAQSIMHAISFIRWPIRLEHMFMYFTCAPVQIIAYTNITSLATWFMWWSAFSLCAMGMYLIDLWILRDSYKNFSKMKGGEEFLESIEERHLFEMKYLVPSAFLFNVLVWLTALVFPHLFENPWVYAIPGLIQFAFSAYALYDCTTNFNKRSAMVATLFAAEK